VLLVLALAVAAAGGRSLLSGAAPGRRDRARLERVVDGDTLVVRVRGRDERVRLIGIDTPESVKPGAPVECGGKAASRAMRRRVHAGDALRLIADPTQDRRDRYGRLLRYVERSGGTDLGRAQVRDGWAAVYVYDGHPFQRVAGYRAAARRARELGLGVHARCGG
jgi:endonuclease YncB( thermonuclease family)